VLSRRSAEALQAQIDELSEPDEWLESVMTKRLIVHTTKDTTIEGSLVAQYDDGIVLRAAALLGSGTAPLPMAGEVFIPREQVFFCQLDG
jgi:hypothetical protein